MLRLWLLRLAIFIPPLVLFVIESHHPAGFSFPAPGTSVSDEICCVFQGLSSKAMWWRNLHIIQTPMIGLVCGTLLYFIRDIRTLAARITRPLIWLLVVVYTALDAGPGIAMGNILIGLDKLNLDVTGLANAQKAVQSFFTNDIFGGVGSVLSLGGSYLWLIVMLLVVYTIFSSDSPRNRNMGLILLTINGVFIWNTHASPYGPIAFFLFFVASGMLLYGTEILPAHSMSVHQSAENAT